jgi:hypothetical protein
MTDTTVTTEAPRNDAGQFESTEPAYGREGLERAAGYVPLETAPEETPDDLTVKEAAEKRIKELSGSESSIVTHTAGLPPNVTMTLDQAADALADARGADAAQAEIDGTKAAQKEIDKLRGEKPAASAPPIETEADIEKVLANPRIRDAIAERVTAADTQRTHYETAVADAGKFAIASLVSDFPEFVDLPLTNWANAINAMHEREPARARLVFNKLQTLARVEQANQQLQAQKTTREQTEFRNYSAKEDARFADMVKGERNMPAIEAEIVAMVKDHGVDPSEFFKAGNESKFLRSAAAQRILVDAAKFRLMQKAAKASPTRTVPTVQKPGFAGPRVDRADTGLAALNAKLSKSGSLKDAVTLRLARSKRR